MHIVGGGFGQTCAEIFQKQNQFWADPISLSSGDTMVKGLPKELFLNVPFLASFSLFSSFQQLTENMFIIIFLPMTELEPQTYGIGSDRSTNWATTTAAVDVRYKPENLIDFIIFLYMDLGLFLYIRLWKNLLRIRCTIWGGIRTWAVNEKITTGPMASYTQWWLLHICQRAVTYVNVWNFRISLLSWYYCWADVNYNSKETTTSSGYPVPTPVPVY